MPFLHSCCICQSRLAAWQPGPCSSCASALCPAPTLRPQAPLRALWARWWFVGTTYDMLLRWKTRPTRRLDELLLLTNACEGAEMEWLRSRRGILVPIPQRFERAWQLGHSPATRLALTLSRTARRSNHALPVVPLLRPSRPDSDLRRQVGLAGQERWNRDRRWTIDLTHLPPEETEVILVDDVITTGATLASAARAIQNFGYPRISAWVLGARPSFSADAWTSTRVAVSSSAPKTCSRAALGP